MELSVPDRSDADQVRVFATFLSGDALRWFEQQKTQHAAQRVPLLLTTMVDLSSTACRRTTRSRS
jgi:hypothetical protein